MARPKDIPTPPPSRPWWFWWALANSLAACFAVLSWVACMWLFQHPENPKVFRLLKKIGRAPELRPYTALDAPSGNSASPQSLRSQVFSLDGEALERLNTQLLRNYLDNLSRPALTNYLEGDFRVLRVRALGPSDLFATGFVVRAQALVRPDEKHDPVPWPVLVDYMFPTADKQASEWFSAGDLFVIRKVPNCACVIHAARFDEGDEPALCLTVAPVAYGDYEVGTSRKFSIKPPTDFNPAAPLPPFGPEPHLILPKAE